jgi:hypothetical protein
MAMLNRTWICMQKHEYPHCDKQHGKKGRNPPCCLVHGRIAEWSDELGIGPIIIALFDTQASGEIRNQKRVCAAKIPTRDARLEVMPNTATTTSTISLVALGKEEACKTRIAAKQATFHCNPHVNR